jgi:hypothetical protein
MRERKRAHYDEAVAELKAAHERRQEAADEHGVRTPAYSVVHLRAIDAVLRLRALESSIDELLDCLLDPDGEEHAAAFTELVWRLEVDAPPRDVAGLLQHVPTGYLAAHVAAYPDDAEAVAELARRLVHT